MKNATLAAIIAGITLVTFFYFPGHTWVQQDTQIYDAILEHLNNPSVLRNDMLVQRPHVSFTLYDEIAIGLHRATGLGFGAVLGAQQVLFRGLGIWGIYLMATAAGLAVGPALLASAILSLGSLILGPTVLTLEYEPDPRAFAVPLAFLAIGLAAHRRYWWAGIAGALGFLIHAPSMWPFWGVYFCLVLWPSKPAVMRGRLYGLVPLLGAAVVLLIASRLQAGVGEPQLFFNRLHPDQEQLQRMRANYVWVSVWWRVLLPHQLVLFAAAMLGYWRVRDRAPVDLRFFLIGLPVMGMLSMPVSYLLLERMKWALIPQLQPTRALLYVLVIAVFAAVVAAARAVERGRWWEAFAWLALAYLPPVNTKVTELPPGNRIATIVLLAALSTLALWAAARKRRWAGPALAVAAAAGFVALPTLGHVVNYPRLHTREMAQLAAWARSSTPLDAVFLFPDAGRDADPGVFRAEALRAVYVDWKGGGQVNYLKELGDLWWDRWQETGKGKFRPADLPKLRRLNIDYLVLRAQNRLPGAAPAFANRQYVAYHITHQYD